MDEPLRRGLTFGVPACLSSCAAVVVVGLAVTASLGTGPFHTSHDADGVRNLRLPDADQAAQHSFGSLASFATQGIALNDAGSVTVTTGATPQEAGIGAGTTVPVTGGGSSPGTSIGAFDGNDLPSVGERGSAAEPVTAESASIPTPATPAGTTSTVTANADPAPAATPSTATGRRRTLLKVLSVADVPTPGSPVARIKVATAVVYADTGELRRYMNFTLASNPKKLTTPGQAMRARVDLVDTPQADGTVSRSVRVRMDVVASAATAQQVDDLGPADGNSNVIQVTTPLTAPDPTPASTTTSDSFGAADEDDTIVIDDESAKDADVEAESADAATEPTEPAHGDSADRRGTEPDAEVDADDQAETAPADTTPAESTTPADTTPEQTPAADDAQADDAQADDAQADGPTLTPPADATTPITPQTDSTAEAGSSTSPAPVSTEPTVTEILIPLDDATDDEAPPAAAASNLVSSTVAAPSATTPTDPTDPTTPAAVAVPVNIKVITQPPKPGDLATTAAAAPPDDE